MWDRCCYLARGKKFSSVEGITRKCTKDDVTLPDDSPVSLYTPIQFLNKSTYIFSLFLLFGNLWMQTIWSFFCVGHAPNTYNAWVTTKNAICSMFICIICIQMHTKVAPPKRHLRDVPVRHLLLWYQYIKNAAKKMKFANFPLLNAANTCRKIIEVVIIKDRTGRSSVIMVSGSWCPIDII